MSDRSRVVRKVAAGDSLYLGPDVMIRGKPIFNGFTIEIKANRHLPVVHVCKGEPCVLEPAATYHRRIFRFDVVHIGPDIDIKLTNAPSDTLRLVINIDRQLQIHHEKLRRREPARQVG